MSSSMLFVIVSFLLVQSYAASSRQIGAPLHIKRTNVNATGAVLPPAFNCVKSGFYPDVKDCTRFYRCVDFFGTEEHFTLFEFICAEGTIFDESLSVCNHPSWVWPAPACMSSGSPVGSGLGGVSGSGSVGGVGVSGGGTGIGSTTESVAVTPGPASSTESVTSNENGLESSTSGGFSESTSFANLESSSESSTSSVDSGAEGETSVAPVDSGSNSSSVPPESLTSGSVEPAEVNTFPTSEIDSSSSTSGSESSTSPSEVSSAQPESTSTESTTTESTTVTTTPLAENIPTSTAPLVQPPSTSEPQTQPAFSLVCGDNKFHRHPLRCDLYYLCVWTELSFSIDLKACPAGSVYDEPSGTCLSPEQSAPCQAPTLPSTSTVAPVTAVSQTSTQAPQYTLAPGSLYNCPRPGHFPYQLDCIRFYRCFEIEPQVLKGLLYRCPAGYGYSTVTERCVKEETLPTCDRTGVRLPADFPVPLIPLEETTMVRLEDLESFFNNPNSFYRPSKFRYIFV